MYWQDAKKYEAKPSNALFALRQTPNTLFLYGMSKVIL